MTLRLLSQNYFQYSLEFVSRLPTTVVTGVALGLILLLWRLIRFSVLPLLHPVDPQEYPYWLPGIGHLFSFFKDSDRLLARGR